MKTIGITGGIGSGKSTVTEFLRRKGFWVVDADLIAREIVEPEHPALQKLVQRFGNEILSADGTLNRKRLAELAFSGPDEKDALDSITHGVIVSTIQEELHQIRINYHPDLIFVDAALMIETGLYKSMDEIWLIVADEKVRVERVIARDNIEAEQVTQRMKLQLSDQEKSKYASRMIDNSTTLNELYRVIERTLKEYEAV